MRKIEITPVEYIYVTAKAYAAPKTIKNHPAVLECNDADASGFTGYKHEVWLKKRWEFESGRNKGCRGSNFNTVAEFKLANPVKTKEK
tara:strand:+ start:276 stop:539 length:264 start_codon:yes stop_codon:yes gene_type:complete